MIACRECRYAIADPLLYAGKWIPIICKCYESDYYLAILNMGISGRKYPDVIAEGCKQGKYFEDKK